MLGRGYEPRLGLGFLILFMYGRLGWVSLVVGFAYFFDWKLRLDDDRLGRAMRLDKRRLALMPRVEHDGSLCLIL